jgi:inorganic pyrophosphatase
LSKVLPRGAMFPFDFGFVPSTLAEDGDPLDVLVLMDEPAFPGCKVACRLIGVIEAEQTNKKGKATRNDRLIAVAQQSEEHKDLHSVKQLPDFLAREIEHFFLSYHQMDGANFKPLGCRGPKTAQKLVRDGVKRSRKKRKAKSRR